MAHIRRRNLPSGKIRWEVNWRVNGDRVTEMFETYLEAKEKRDTVQTTKPSSVQEFRIMAKAYLRHEETLVETGQHERSYLDMLKNHIDRHILTDKEFAGLRCCSINTPDVQLFLNRLITRISAKSARKIRVTLTQVFTFGAQVGYVAGNPSREAKVTLKRRPDAGDEASFILPGKNALRTLLEGARTFDQTGRAQAVVRTLMFGGLRMSEMRGMERKSADVIGSKPQIHINQRADRYNAIGSVKSSAGRRTVDIGPETAQAIRIWLMAAPKPRPSDEDQTTPKLLRPEYVFPNEEGGVWGYANFRSRFWVPLMNHCGLVTDKAADRHIRMFTKAQRSFKSPLFSPHMLRHVYASLQIERGVTPKRLQKLIGHGTLKMTLDTYGHLWPDEDADLARARGVENAI